MAVYHILKDGSRPTDITGHVVKIEDAEPLYRFLHTISTKKYPDTEKTHTYNRGIINV